MRHLTTLQLAVARGELMKPYRPNAYADLIHRKGEEHETAYLARLRDEGREWAAAGAGSRTFSSASRVAGTRWSTRSSRGTRTA